MPLSIALQIDPPHTLNPLGDTSLLLARAAQARGHDVYYLPPQSVSQSSYGDIEGTLQPLDLHETTSENWFSLGEARRAPLTELDVILVRQDPPFDMAYISNSMMLERVIETGTLVLNHPAAVRNNPEKLIPLHFPEYSPPTLITSDVQAIREFWQRCGDIVLKPAYGYGGRGIIKIPKSGDNLEAILEMHSQQSKEPLVAQQFLPDVAEQEKRVILIDGKISGAFGRIPAKGEIRSNMRVGGQVVKTELTQRQHDMAYDVGKFCQSMGLLLVGLDVIGDYLTEVNVTSPTGLMQLKSLYGLTPEEDFWNAVDEIITMRDQALEQLVG